MFLDRQNNYLPLLHIHDFHDMDHRELRNLHDIGLCSMDHAQQKYFQIPLAVFKNLNKLSSRIFSSNPRTGFDNSWLSFIGWPNNRWFGDTYRRYRI